MKRTTKAERNHKREEFTKAALLYCDAQTRPSECTREMDQRLWADVMLKYEALSKENE